MKKLLSTLLPLMSISAIDVTSLPNIVTSIEQNYKTQKDDQKWGVVNLNTISQSNLTKNTWSDSIDQRNEITLSMKQVSQISAQTFKQRLYIAIAEAFDNSYTNLEKNWNVSLTDLATSNNYDEALKISLINSNDTNAVKNGLFSTYASSMNYHGITIYKNWVKTFLLNVSNSTSSFNISLTLTNFSLNNDKKLIIANDKIHPDWTYHHSWTQYVNQTDWFDNSYRWTDAISPQFVTNQDVMSYFDTIGISGSALSIGCSAFWGSFWNASEAWSISGPISSLHSGGIRKYAVNEYNSDYDLYGSDYLRVTSLADWNYGFSTLDHWDLSSTSWNTYWVYAHNQSSLHKMYITSISSMYSQL